MDTCNFLSVSRFSWLGLESIFLCDHCFYAADDHQGLHAVRSGVRSVMEHIFWCILCKIRVADRIDHFYYGYGFSC